MRALVTMLIAVIMVVLGANSYATEDFLALTNADRLSNGLAPLTIAPDLQAYAQRWAEEMQRAGKISHSTVLTDMASPRWIGENVGQGRNLTQIESAFMASPAHRANILRPDFSEAGVAVVWDGAVNFYVAVIFRQAATAAPPAPAGVEAKPAPAAAKANPAPAPRSTSSLPRTVRPKPTPAPPPAISPPAEVPPPPPPSEPAGIEHPAPLAREAGPRLSWVLAATTGTSVSAADAHGGASPALVVEANTKARDRLVGAGGMVLLACIGVSVGRRVVRASQTGPAGQGSMR